MRLSVMLVAFLAACSAGVPEPPAKEYLVQYPRPVDGADSLVLTYFDASIDLDIPIAKSLVIRSTRSLADLRTIPDIATIDPLDSLNQVIDAIVFFNTAPADYTLSAVKELASGHHISTPLDSNSLWIDTAFRLSAVNAIATIYNVREVDLETPSTFSTQASLRRAARRPQ